MTLSGPQALSSLEEALRDIRREEDEIAKRLARSNERVAKFRETEADLFRQLAMLRMDPAVQAELNERISQAEAKARDMFARHGEEIGSAEAELKKLDEAIAGHNGRRAELLAEVDRRQAELKALSAKIAQAVAKDPDFAKKRQDAATLASIAEESLRKTTQAEQDRDEKGKPYRDDPLFMYLWERGYGTKNYRANNLFAWLDGKVADLVGYAKARPNFAMLNELPIRLREHAERQLANARAAEQEVDEAETRAIDAAGGQPIREALSQAQAEIARIDEAIVAAEDERDEKARAVRQLAQGSNPAFAEALAALAAELGREDIKSLLAQARATRTGQDDTIIAQIDENRVRIREEEAETRDQRERAKTLAARRRELEDISYEFKKARFDDPRSSFRQDSLVGDVLNDFLRGGISASSYWDQWRRSQNWTPGSSDWGGGIGLPRNGRSGPSWTDADERGGFRQREEDAIDWGDLIFGGGGSSSSSSGGGFSWPKSSGRSSSGSSGGFSRPRSGSTGTRKTGGFRTGGGF